MGLVSNDPTNAVWKYKIINIIILWFCCEIILYRCTSILSIDMIDFDIDIDMISIDFDMIIDCF